MWWACKGSAHFFNELVTSVKTSCFSSSSKLVARWPRRLSANRGDARSFRHSTWPKWVRSPRVKRYSSFATLLRLFPRHSLMSISVHCSLTQDADSTRNPPYAMVVALLAEAGSDRGALFLDDGSFVGNRLGRTHVADELLHCGRRRGSAIGASRAPAKGGQDTYRNSSSRQGRLTGCYPEEPQAVDGGKRW